MPETRICWWGTEPPFYGGSGSIFQTSKKEKLFSLIRRNLDQIYKDDMIQGSKWQKLSVLYGAVPDPLFWPGTDPIWPESSPEPQTSRAGKKNWQLRNKVRKYLNLNCLILFRYFTTVLHLLLNLFSSQELSVVGLKKADMRFTEQI